MNVNNIMKVACLLSLALLLMASSAVAATSYFEEHTFKIKPDTIANQRIHLPWHDSIILVDSDSPLDRISCQVINLGDGRTWFEVTNVPFCYFNPQNVSFPTNMSVKVINTSDKILNAHVLVTQLDKVSQ